MINHYDVHIPLRLYCDASSYGLDACLVDALVDNSKRLVAYASCTLTALERNYTQVEYEALAIIFAVCIQVSPISVWETFHFSD